MRECTAVDLETIASSLCVYILIIVDQVTSDGASNFYLGGYSPGGSGDGSPPMRSRGETPVRILGRTFVPQKL